MPSLSNLPWILGAPHNGWRGSSRGSAGEFPTTPLVGRSGVAISGANTIGSPRGAIYNSVRLNDRKLTTGLSEQPVKTNENQSVNWVESELARRPSPKHIDLLPQDQNLGLKRSSRPEKIREHPPDQSAQVQHHATASPDSQSTTSRIWFAVGTPKHCPIRPQLPAGLGFRQGQPPVCDEINVVSSST